MTQLMLISMALALLSSAPQDRVEESRLVGSPGDAPFGVVLTTSGSHAYIGAPDSDAIAPGAGHVQHVERVGGTWELRPSLLPAEIGVDVGFGASITADDGRLVVGMPQWPDEGAGTNGRVAIYRLGSSWTEEQLLPSRARAWGELVALDGDRMLVRGRVPRGGNAFVLSYVRSAHGWREDAEVLPPGGQTDIQFGAAFDIEGDLLAVSAPDLEINGVPNAGGVWILERRGSGWSLVQRVDAPNLSSEDGFGEAVCLHEGRLFVGAPGKNGTHRSGKVYAFQKGRIWTLHQEYSGPANERQRFGASIVCDRNFLAIGAPLAKRSGGGLGQVRTYLPSGNDVLEPATSLPSDRFGTDLALGGFSSLLAVSAVDDASGSRAVWVFTRAQKRWTQSAEIVPEVGDRDFLAGLTFAKSDLLVSAPGAPRSNARNGVVRDYFSTDWMPQAEIQPPLEIVDEAFGSAVASSDRVVAVGAPFDDDLDPNAGSVTLFDLNGQLITKLLPTARSVQSMLGSAVATAGDVLAASAPGDDAFAQDAGAIHLFVEQAGVWDFAQRLTPHAGFAADAYGAAVSATTQRIAVGAPASAGPNGSDVGAVLLYTRSGMTWSLEEVLQPAHLPAGARFGSALQLDESRLLVGAPGHALESVGLDAGAAFLFRHASDGWREMPRMQAAAPVPGDEFGHSVAMLEERLSIGAPGTDNGPPNSGALHLFSDCGVGAPALRGVTSDPRSDIQLGAATAFMADDDLVLAGVPGDRRVRGTRGSVASFDVNDTDFVTADFIATSATVSAAGGFVDFGLCLPTPPNANDRFFVLGSLRGSSPGFVYDGFTIPLNIDAYFTLTAVRPDALFLQPSIGSFADDGRASVRFEIPALPAGLTFTHAYVVYDPATNKLSYVSSPVDVMTQ